ncbi:PEGA domain-containing protein, partial [candidate division WWE3 bacterium]|nr:PEGA domain-containing protein [candidate division WWE3 bacterium]
MKSIWWTLLSLLILGGVTTGVYLYSTGYRVDVKKREVTSTGMIAIKSIPDGAQVYLEGLLTTATNGTITSVTPGTHHLKVVKNGFVSWEKEVEVFEQLVTDITAVLISKTPRLEPLTSEGARSPVTSPSLTKIAYFTKDGTSPGVWIFPLGTNFQVNLFKSTPDVVLKDTARIIYSNGEQIEWSPDEREIMVKMNEKSYFLVNFQTKVTESTSSAEPTRRRWGNEVLKKREIFLASLGLSKEMQEIALDSETIWSPDEKKFLYKVQEDGMIHYKVEDLEKPLPVGEKTNYTTFSLKES